MNDTIRAMMHWVLRVVFSVLALLGIAFAAGTYHTQEKAAAICPKCNVILISLDSLGMKHTTLGDPALSTTPFLARIASERGVVFSNAYSQAPWSLPSHVSMLTGEYPWKFHVWNTLNQLPDSAVSIAEILTAKGYATAAFSTGWFVAPRWNTTQGFSSYTGTLAEQDWDDIPSLFTEAEAWIHARPTDAPFFLFLHPFGIHDPYGDIARNADIVHIQEIAKENLAPEGPRSEAIERFRARYQQDVRAADSALEAFMSSLQEAGLLSKTIIIITSPHGEEFGEHGSVGLHSITTYAEVLHVPLVVIIPNEKSRVVHQTVEVRSIPATILDILGYRDSDSDAPALAREHSLLRTDLGEQVSLGGTLFDRSGYLPTISAGYQSLSDMESLVSTSAQTTVTQERITTSAIQGRWHVIKNRTGEIEVYDMVSDPLESDNLADVLYALPVQDRAIVTMLQLSLLQVK